MKKTLIILSLLSLIIKLNAQCVLSLGADDYNQASAKAASYTDIAVNSIDVPYIVYADNNGFLNECVIKKFTANRWNILDKFTSSSDLFWFSRIQISSNDTLYVSYINNQKLYIYKRLGSIWKLLGVPINYSINHQYCFKLDKQNTPHLAINDNGAGSKLTVFKWNGVNWIPVGMPGISTSTVGTKSLAFDTLNNPIVAYIDSGGVYAKEFNGSTWNLLGNNIPVSPFPLNEFELNVNNQNKKYFIYATPCGGMLEFDGTSWNWSGAYFSSNNAASLNLNFNSSGEPIIAFSEFKSGLWKAVAKKYNGTNWIAIGTPTNISIGNPNYTSMTMDKNKNPYLIFTDGRNSQKATVRKLNTNNWDLLGDIGISDSLNFNGSLACKKNGEVFLSYFQNNISRNLHVKKFNGGTWVDVFGTNIFNSPYYCNQLKFDNNDSLYLLTSDINSAPILRKYDGISTWRTIGNLNTVNQSFITFEINPKTNEPYIAYANFNDSDKVVVSKFNGTSWVNVGPSGFTHVGAKSISLTFDTSGTPHIAFEHKFTYYFSLMKFNGIAWTNIIPPTYWMALGEPKILITKNNDFHFFKMSTNGLLCYKVSSSNLISTGTLPLSNAYNKYYLVSQDNLGNPIVSSIYSSNTAPYGYEGYSLWRYMNNNWNYILQKEISASTIDFPLLAADTIGNIYIGYSSERQFVKKIIPANPVKITTTKDTICLGESTTLSANGIGNFYWSNGLTNSSIIVSPTSTTTYSLISDSTGCMSFDYKNIVVNPCVNIDEIKKPFMFSNLFPNPSTGTFQLTINDENYSLSDIEIVDISGKTLLRKTINDNSIIIHTNFADGIYFIRIKTSYGHDEFHKLIISR